MNRYFLHSILLISISKEVLVEGNGKSICSICSCVDKTINCGNLKLEESFDEAAWLEIGKSEYTKALFNGNHISHVLRFPTLPLVTLSFKNNRIVRIDNRAFKNLTSLEELDLSGNRLTSNNLLPPVFEGHFDAEWLDTLELRLLDLSGNELHTLHPDLFRHITKLERLYLRQNPFKILDKSTVIAISSLPNITILDLSFTKIKELPMGFLHTPRRLNELFLKGNLFTEVPFDVLAESHDLKILNLNENPIKVLSTERSFPELPKLKELHISFMPNLTRIEAGALSGLTGLEYLYCRMNDKLGYISPLAFSKNESEEKWPNIVKLDLSDNALRYLDHEFLKPIWNQIKHINILGNPWMCDCENQWIVSELVPLMINISSPVDGLECAEPPIMKGMRFVTIYAKNHTMKCLDLYGNHPENDGPILISIFVIVVLTLIIVLGVIVWLRGNNNTCRKGGRVNYQRAFYRPTKLEDPDKY